MVLLLIGNVIRMIEKKLVDYTVHYLYGASLHHIRQRAGGFILLLHIVPCLGVLYQLYKSFLSYEIYGIYDIAPHRAVWFMIILLLYLMVLYLFAAFYAGKRVTISKGLNNLRRD